MNVLAIVTLYPWKTFFQSKSEWMLIVFLYVSLYECIIRLNKIYFGFRGNHITKIPSVSDAIMFSTWCIQPYTHVTSNGIFLSKGFDFPNKEICLSIKSLSSPRGRRGFDPDEESITPLSLIRAHIGILPILYYYNYLSMVISIATKRKLDHRSQ